MRGRSSAGADCQPGGSFIFTSTSRREQSCFFTFSRSQVDHFKVTAAETTTNLRRTCTRNQKRVSPEKKLFSAAHSLVSSSTATAFASCEAPSLLISSRPSSSAIPQAKPVCSAKHTSEDSGTPQEPLDLQAQKKPSQRPPSPKPSRNPFAPLRALLRTPERPTQSPPDPPQRTTPQESSPKRAEEGLPSQKNTEKKSPLRPAPPRPTPIIVTPKTTPECVKPSFTPQKEENVRKLIEQADRLEEQHRQLTSAFDRESTFIEDQLLQNGTPKFDEQEPIDITDPSQDSDRAKRLDDRNKRKLTMDLKELKSEMEKLGQVFEKKVSEDAARNLDLYPSFIGSKDDKTFHEFYTEFLRRTSSPPNRIEEETNAEVTSMKKIDDEEERIAASTLKRENRAAATFPGREEPKHHSSAETAVRTDASSTADEKSYRFAIDFRRVNKITAPEVYLPLISDLIDSVGSKIYFSTFDFTSGFWQLPLAEEDVEKTAFITFMGLFEFLRMPFGLCGAPATFQKAMQEMRREITAAAFIYLDDIVIASNTEEEHVKDVDQFLSVVERYGLKLKLEKCQFARAEVKYLGLLYPAMMPSRANQRAKKPLAPKEDLKLRLAIMEHHLATLIIDPGTLTRPSWGPEPRQEKDHGSGRERWLTRRGWISAISEELRKWAENPPLSAARRQELYEELVKTEGSPIVFGRNDREGLHYLHIVPERATAPEPNYEFGYDDEDDDSDDWERFLEEARRRYARHEAPRLGFDAWAAQNDGAPTRHPLVRAPSPRRSTARPHRRSSPSSSRRSTPRMEYRPVSRPHRRSSPPSSRRSTSRLERPSTSRRERSSTSRRERRSNSPADGHSTSPSTDSEEFFSAAEENSLPKRRVGAE
ncbi:hypothetical protein QR680_014310 [Steinernema hermaphroditum]|uniref:Reverse transcriptase domain-containing protein n=1 Tax=Steinernema hermaphroditum TaxID=289476 RepID=A0AA39I8G8_9BILA|nr:hypothetical protein QR680_014310 [Steinernema hermaphroditum]